MAAEVAYQFVSLAEVQNQPLAWVQVKGWKQRFELRAGDHLVAIMRWDGIFKSTATVESAEGVWHLARRGFFNWHTDLQVQDRLEPALILHHRWDRAELTLPDGRELRWRYANFWATKYAFFDQATNAPLITFHYKGFFKYHADIILDVQAQSLPSLLMLLTLGWYQVILQIGDSAAAAG